MKELKKVIGEPWFPGLTLKMVLNMLQPPFNCCPFNTSLQVHNLVNEISLQMDVKAIIVIQLPW
jgi:hypothetical protein